jgi:hypothetical protein
MSIRYGIPMGEYLSIDALSGSMAFEALTRSPFHAKHSRLTKEWAKGASIGTVAHQLLLEDSEDGIVLVDAKDWRTKAAQEARDAACAEGKTPILADQMTEIRRLVDAVRRQIANTEIGRVFGTGKAEVTVEWNDNGVACKARPDYLTDDFHISVKTTTASAEPSSFNRRMISSNGYDFSLAFYDRGLRKNGIEVEHRLLVIEQNPPYGVSVIALAPNKKVIAEMMADRAIKVWKECLETNHFPGYSTETFMAEATPWELADAEEREMNYLQMGATA